jgi:diaminopimelate decarboxylase
MQNYEYRQSVLGVEGVDLAAVANAHGTPTYAYSAAMIRERFHAYSDSLQGMPHRVCYAVKANSNLAILALLAREGAGFDIVSGGELYRVLKAGGQAAHTVFSGVGKTPEEMEYALRQGVHSFNCESHAEIDVLNQVAARLGVRASVALRVNPDVNPVTHPYISTGLKDNKFGIDMSIVEQAYADAASKSHLRVTGVSCHIGSLMMDPAPMLEAVEKLVALALRLKSQGLPIDHLDLGGGLGVAYAESETTPSIQDALAQMRARVEPTGLTVMVEPGRSIVAESGVLLTRVLFRKNNGGKEFTIVDAAMNDLIRPSLYRAHHEIVPVIAAEAEPYTTDIVGPVCESGDWLAKERIMPGLKDGDLLAIKTAGAYGFGMASNYNSRPRPSEVLISGDTFYVIRQRETLEDLIRGEQVTL